jgi:hypothetical protein
METGETAAAEFLKLAATDADLRATFESAIDENLFTISVVIGKERGLEFTKEQLEKQLATEIGLEEFRLRETPDGGTPTTRSGCRTPCVYCNHIKIVRTDLPT